jgi:hypothetical protein
MSKGGGLLAPSSTQLSSVRIILPRILRYRACAKVVRRRGVGGVPVSLCGIRIGSESEGGGTEAAAGGADEVTGTFGLPRYLIGALIATARNVRLLPASQGTHVPAG